MSNLDIDLIVSSKQKLKQNYRGTWSKDKIPNLVYKSGDWSIINLEDSDAGNGTHWVCFMINQDDVLLFLDSYGVYPPEIIKKIARASSCDDIWYQYERLQGESQICGWYCLKFISMMLEDDFDFKKINPTTLNDSIVRKFQSLLQAE